MEKRKKRKAVKKGYLAYCLAFVAVCAVPSVMMLIPSKAKADSSAEKRILAKMPSLQKEDGSLNEDFGDEFTAYVSDHFGFRQELADIDSRMKSKLFQTSSEKDVIIGKDGWLYYTPTQDDYVNNPTISDHGTQNIVYNLKMLQDYTQSKGAKFLTAIVPNKNTVYPEYMPDYVRPAQQNGNLENLSNAIQGTEISFLNLADVLIPAKDENPTPIYYQTDTHWNNTGALIGYPAMMGKIKTLYPNYENSHYVTEPVHEGDLWKMLYPTSEELENENIYDMEFSFEYQGLYRSADDILITTLNTGQESTDSLLMFRDSFGAGIIPYFSEQFRLAKYSRAVPYTFYDMESEEYNAVIVEIVERNISRLQESAPVHGAPYAENVPEISSDSMKITSASIEDFNGAYVHVFGAFDVPETLTGMEHYFVTMTDDSGKSISYLAYHCYEKDKISEDSANYRDNGYSLYIPTPDLSSGHHYSLTLTIQGNDSCYGCAIGEFTT